MSEWSALDDAVARLSGRLAAVLRALDGAGTDAGAAFLQSQADRAPAGVPADNSCLDLPRPGAEQPVHRLLAALGPDAQEIDLLVLAASAHHHEGIASVLRGLHPEGRPWPTVGLAGLMAEHGALAGSALAGAPGAGRAAVRAALSRGLLVRSGALTVPGDGPYSERSLVLDPLLWAALAGGTTDDNTWPAGCRVDSRPAPPDGLEDWFDLASVRAAGAAIEQRRAVAVAARATRPGAVAGRLVALVRAAGERAVTLHVPLLDDAVARRILLIALARGEVPVLWSDRPPTGPLPAAHLPLPLIVVAPPPQQVETDAPGRAAEVAGAIEAWPRIVLEVPTGALDRRSRLRAIAAALPEVAAPQYPLGPATLEPRDVAVAAAGLQAAAELGGEAPSIRRLSEAVDTGTSAAVPAGAVLVHPAACWRDLILPADRRRQLHEAVDRVRAQRLVFDEWGFLQGRPGRAGLRLLLSGPSGTGKTLAAEVVASELGCDLLIIDLSRLVSKWLGETEKNLAAAFDAAETGGCALFFDEADALFGKRTEVGDARDRYANLETAYLLSRLERFSGVAILATNLRQNLDAAFARRLDFIVPFDPPEHAERVLLWRRHLPEQAPIAPSVDVERLGALYDVPGALIRNAALAAAFLAASDGHGGGPGPITSAHVVHALRREYAKAGLAFPGAPARLASVGTTPHTDKENSRWLV